MAEQWPTRTSPLKVQSKVQPEEYIDLYSNIFNCSYYNASPPSQGQSFHTRAVFIEYMLFIDARARQKVKVEIYTGIYLQTLCQCLDCFGNIVSCCYQRSAINEIFLYFYYFAQKSGRKIVKMCHSSNSFKDTAKLLI